MYDLNGDMLDINLSTDDNFWVEAKIFQTAQT